MVLIEHSVVLQHKIAHRASLVCRFCDICYVAAGKMVARVVVAMASSSSAMRGLYLRDCPCATSGLHTEILVLSVDMARVSAS